jgi:hypothetical protein
MTALGGFLTSVLASGTPIILGQANRVPEPGAPDFVMMTPTSAVRLETNTDTWITTAEPTTISTLTPMQYTVQLDCHGSGGGDNAQLIASLLRDRYAADYFNGLNVGVAPLYSSDPIQLAMVNGEGQYEDRWTLSAVLQTNPVIVTAQQFADSLVIGLIEVDTTYPG